MPWFDNAPEQEAHRALLILSETRGSQTTIAFLKQELQRLLVVEEMRNASRQLVAAEERVSEAEKRLAAAKDALEFYADPDNYKSRSGKSSAIERDKGRAALDALEVIEPEGENGDEG